MQLIVEASMPQESTPQHLFDTKAALYGDRDNLGRLVYYPTEDLKGGDLTRFAEAVLLLGPYVEKAFAQAVGRPDNAVQYVFLQGSALIINSLPNHTQVQHPHIDRLCVEFVLFPEDDNAMREGGGAICTSFLCTTTNGRYVLVQPGSHKLWRPVILDEKEVDSNLSKEEQEKELEYRVRVNAMTLEARVAHIHEVIQQKMELGEQPGDELYQEEVLKHIELGPDASHLPWFPVFIPYGGLLLFSIALSHLGLPNLDGEMSAIIFAGAAHHQARASADAPPSNQTWFVEQCQFMPDLEKKRLSLVCNLCGLVMTTGTSEWFQEVLAANKPGRVWDPACMAYLQAQPDFPKANVQCFRAEITHEAFEDTVGGIKTWFSRMIASDSVTAAAAAAAHRRVKSVQDNLPAHLPASGMIDNSANRKLVVTGNVTLSTRLQQYFTRHNAQWPTPDARSKDLAAMLIVLLPLDPHCRSYKRNAGGDKKFLTKLQFDTLVDKMVAKFKTKYPNGEHLVKATEMIQLGVNDWKLRKHN